MKRVILLGGRCYSSIGGIQAFNRTLVQALNTEGRLHKALLRFDHAEDVPDELRNKVFAHNGSSSTLIISSVLAGIRASKCIWLCDHLNYGPLAALVSNGDYIIYTHAHELTRPISCIRRLALLRSKRVVCVSEYGASLARRVGIPDSKLSIIPHGQDFEVGQRVLQEVPRILFVGRLDRSYKGLDHLIKACARLMAHGSIFELRIVGGGESLPHYKKLSEKFKLSANFLGWTDENTLDHEFSRADIFALPSNGEGFGLVYLQAMANSIPCISGNRDAGREIVQDGKTGYVTEYGNHFELAIALKNLLDNPMLRLEMGRKGLERYLARYTGSAFKKRLIRFLDCLES